MLSTIEKKRTTTAKVGFVGVALGASISEFLFHVAINAYVVHICEIGLVYRCTECRKLSEDAFSVKVGDIVQENC